MALNPKKTSKSKAKKEKRKQVLEKENELRSIITAAYAVENQLSLLPPLFSTFERNGLALDLEFFPVSKLVADTQLFEWVFTLTKKNMQPIYEQGFGWNDSRKRSELKEDNALYIIAFQRQPQRLPVAFVNFRFESSEGTTLLYLYEIQLEDSVRRKGLGKFLMLILELIGKKHKIHQLCFTVQKANEDAMRFYKSLRYELDPASPSRVDPINEYPYEVFSKRLDHPAQKQ